MPERGGSADIGEIREAALRLLARREHSVAELSRKLLQRGWPEPEAEATIARLAAENLQSDQRFAESYARSRAARHYGPLRIRAELAERGIDRNLASRAVADLGVDWTTLAASWYERRYGAAAPDSLKEKSRRQQALARRGFAHEDIRALFPALD